MNYKNLAIIPARAGSKRLPDKNILQLSGKPLIAWTIEAAIKANIFDKIIVSTDSERIKNISEQYGAEVPFIRPEALANDTARTIDVIFHAIKFYEQQNIKFDYITLLQPTSPLRTSEHIKAAFELIDEETKAVVSVCETEHNPLWSNTLPENLNMKNFIKPEIKNLRSQDLPVYYRLNGAIYIAQTLYLIENQGFIGKSTKAFIMPQKYSIDIDTKLDFAFCEFFIKNFDIN